MKSVDRILADVESLGTGDPIFSTNEAAVRLRVAPMESRAAKKHGLKDSRLETHYESVLTSASRMDALRDHGGNERAKVKKKTARQPPNSNRKVVW